MDKEHESDAGATSQSKLPVTSHAGLGPPDRTPAGETTSTGSEVVVTAKERASLSRIGLAGKKWKVLTAKATAGKLIDRLGLFNIGATELVRTDEQLQESIAQCDELIKATDDPELKAKVLEIKDSLMEKSIEVVEMFLKAKPQTQPQQESPLNVNVADGAQVAIEINKAKK